MAPQIIQPPDKYMLKTGVVDREAVLGHLRMVLNAFANKTEYNKFYIGITNDVDVRLLDHQRRKPDFKLMVPIYEEQSVLVDNAFDRLERDAIRRFQDGIKHPDTHRVLLECKNGPGGAPPKNTLYVLVG
jgi:hypothetical protein